MVNLFQKNKAGIKRKYLPKSIKLGTHKVEKVEEDQEDDEMIENIVIETMMTKVLNGNDVTEKEIEEEIEKVEKEMEQHEEQENECATADIDPNEINKEGKQFMVKTDDGLILAVVIAKKKAQGLLHLSRSILFEILEGKVDHLGVEAKEHFIPNYQKIDDFHFETWVQKCQKGRI